MWKEFYNFNNIRIIYVAYVVSEFSKEVLILYSFYLFYDLHEKLSLLKYLVLCFHEKQCKYQPYLQQSYGYNRCVYDRDNLQLKAIKFVVAQINTINRQLRCYRHEFFFLVLVVFHCCWHNSHKFMDKATQKKNKKNCVYKTIFL